jgi:hypothetical protein
MDHTDRSSSFTRASREEAALAKLKPYESRERVRFKPSDRLLAFLEAL